MSDWFLYAGHARSFLDLYEKLASNRIPEESEWRALPTAVGHDGNESGRESDWFWQKLMLANRPPFRSIHLRLSAASDPMAGLGVWWLAGLDGTDLFRFPRATTEDRDTIRWFTQSGCQLIPQEELVWYRSPEGANHRSTMANYWYSLVLNAHRVRLAECLSVWLGPAWVNLAPRFVWGDDLPVENDKTPHLELMEAVPAPMYNRASFTLLSLLAVKLVEALSSGVYRCSVCHEPFTLRVSDDGRKVRHDRRLYCYRTECLLERDRRSKRETYRRKRDRAAQERLGGSTT
ncbi:MAG TPA: hypothetical protein VGN26_12225 [Armatimonadota bacterium]